MVNKNYLDYHLQWFFKQFDRFTISQGFPVGTYFWAHNIRGTCHGLAAMKFDIRHALPPSVQGLFSFTPQNDLDKTHHRFSDACCRSTAQRIRQQRPKKSLLCASCKRLLEGNSTARPPRGFTSSTVGHQVDGNDELWHHSWNHYWLILHTIIHIWRFPKCHGGTPKSSGNLPKYWNHVENQWFGVAIF